MGRAVAGSYAVASIVRSSAASGGAGSFGHQAASIAVASAVMLEAGSEFYALEFAVLAERFSVDAVAIETPIRCPVKDGISIKFACHRRLENLPPTTLKLIPRSRKSN